MTGNLRLPYHLEALFVWLKKQGVQGRSVLILRAVVEVSCHSKTHSRQAKTQVSIRCHVVELDNLATLQQSIDLLVFGGALVEVLIKIRRQEGLSRLLPVLVIGSGKVHPGYPVAGDRPETSWFPSPQTIV